jgi:hypothetical protein
MCAMAEKVVPKSIPIAFRGFIAGELTGTRARILRATFVPDRPPISPLAPGVPTYRDSAINGSKRRPICRY